MNRILRRAAVFAAAALFLGQSFAMAAGLTSMRFHSGSEHDRVVYEFTDMPAYTTAVSADGRTLTLDLADTSYKGFSAVPAKGSRIESIAYNKKGKHLIVTMKLKAGLSYQVRTLKNPTRLFIDVLPDTSAATSTAGTAASKPAVTATKGSSTGMPGTIDGDYVQEIEPGLTEHTYVYWDDYGKVSAWLLEADPARYRLVPTLAKGKIPGREAVSGIVARAGGVAGINASYFAPAGDILGVTQINGQTVGTTYYTRSAFGLRKDGTPVFGKISYDGTVTMGGVSVSVAGVDCERGADSLVIYNRAYGSSTGTNEYGREYIVRGGRVTDGGLKRQKVVINALTFGAGAQMCAQCLHLLRRQFAVEQLADLLLVMFTGAHPSAPPFVCFDAYRSGRFPSASRKSQSRRRARNRRDFTVPASRRSTLPISA